MGSTIISVVGALVGPGDSASAHTERSGKEFIHYAACPLVEAAYLCQLIHAVISGIELARASMKIACPVTISAQTACSARVLGNTSQLQRVSHVLRSCLNS